MALEFTVLEENNNLKPEDYIKAIESNHAIALSMQKEIVPIIMKSKPSIVEEKKDVDTITVDETESDDEITFFDDSVEYYMSMLDSISDEEFLKGDIEFALPSKNNVNYDNIITRICCEYLKQIKEIEELLFEEQATLSASDLYEFKEEVNILNKKIETVKREQEEQLKEDKVVKNNLVFVPTISGNIKVIEELSSINEDYYERFNGLFESIIDGTFKNVKRFVSNDKFTGLCEVRDFKTRVLFARIGKKDYAIISAFVKKTNVDKAYTTRVELSYKNYQNYKDSLIALKDEPTFIQENICYQTELFSMLGNNTKKNKVKEKVDDTNGKNN